MGSILQRNHIHLAVRAPGTVTRTLPALKASAGTAKACFILATDGVDFEAEDFDTGETVAYPYADFPDQFGFFPPLAGITSVKQVRDSSFDIRAIPRTVCALYNAR